MCNVFKFNLNEKHSHLIVVDGFCLFICFLMVFIAVSWLLCNWLVSINDLVISFLFLHFYHDYFSRVDVCNISTRPLSPSKFQFSEDMYIFFLNIQHINEL